MTSARSSIPLQRLSMRHASEQIRLIFLHEVSRRLEESVFRLRVCLELLTPEEIWKKPNEHSNSVGNIVLHLCGNVRQWVLSGLGGLSDNREREKEFSQQEPISSEALMVKVHEVMNEVESLLKIVDEEKLLASYRVQGFRETGIAILLHVVEHFSYHVGQITYYTKLTKDIDTNYYKGVDLNKKG